MQGGTKALGIWILTVVGAAAWSLPVPAQDADPLTRIAFGSCAHQAKPQPIWDAVLDYRPELFIFTGDNVYGDVTSAAVTELREAYARAAAIEGYAKVRATVPVLATWDDHDYGRNDAGADFAHKAAAKQLFLDFWRVPHDDLRRTRDGIYHAETIGPEGMRAGRPAGYPQLPLTAALDRSAGHPRQGSLSAGSRPGQDHARRGAMGVAAHPADAAGGAAPDRLLGPGAGRGSRLGRLGQPAARAHEAARPTT